MLRRALPRAVPLSVHLPSLATPTTTAVLFVSPPTTQCAALDHHHLHHGAADYCARLHPLDDAPPRHQTTKARYADLLLSPCCYCYTSLLWRSTMLRPTTMLRGPHTASPPLSFTDITTLGPPPDVAPGAPYVESEAQPLTKWSAVKQLHDDATKKQYVDAWLEDYNKTRKTQAKQPLEWSDRVRRTYVTTFLDYAAQLEDATITLTAFREQLSKLLTPKMPKTHVNVAARPTPSTASGKSSGSVRTAPHTPLPFEKRKPAFLTEMYYKRKVIFNHTFEERLKYVNDTIGERHKVALTGDAAVFALYDYLTSADSQTDLDKYIKKVNEASIPIKDTDFTYEQLLLDSCEKKSSLKPWDNLVPRLVDFKVEGMKPAGQVHKWCTVISLFGSSGCGKSEALKAVAEEIIKKLPNHVVYLRLDWKSDIRSTDRNIEVSKKLLKDVDTHVKRKIAEEVARGAPLPDPKNFALVVTLDEIGRVPESARALVSISRQLNGDDRTPVPPAVLTLRKVFGDVVIVLAGTSGETVATLNGETVITSNSEQGGIVVSDSTMVHFCNMDTPHCKVNGKVLTPEEYREALVRHHITLITHNPWLGGRLLKSRLRLALDNPRVVGIVAEITRLLYASTPDKADVPAAFPDEHDSTNPLSLHEFDHWALLLANRYCALNGLSYFSPFSPDPHAHSQRQRVFLHAHYVWDHYASVEIDALVKEVLTSVETGSLRSNQAERLLKLQRLGLLTFLDLVEVNEKKQQYKVSIPPSLPYIALAALDCTVGFGGGGWSAWEDVAMQSVGLRFAAAMAWKGCATLGDAVPGLYVDEEQPLQSGEPATPQSNALPNPFLAWPIHSVGNSEVRHWCAVVAPVPLCGYARKEFNPVEETKKIEEEFEAMQVENEQDELENRLAKAKEEFEKKQDENKQRHNEKVGTYWKEKVLPLLEKHSIVLVQNCDKASATDCFALIRVDRTSAGKPIRADEELDGKPILVVAQLQMKDFRYSSAPKVDEEMAKMGFYIDGITMARRKKMVKKIYTRSENHRTIMQAAFPEYKLHFGAVICMSRAEPKPTLKHSWKSLATLQDELCGTGVMYATPVLQRVFHPFDAPAEAVAVKEKEKEKENAPSVDDDTEGPNSENADTSADEATEGSDWEDL